MSIWITVLVCFLAGAGAGIGTGFAGMSATAVIGPMLISFLGVPAYTAIGIGLASDVLASGISAVVYKKHKNIDIKNGLVMMGTILLFTVLGSYLSSLLPNTAMSNFSAFTTLFLGVEFLVKPVNTTRENMQRVSVRKRMVESIVCGMIIGLICGFIGMGGGMMMLFVLTFVMGYELKCAVGTSVFIMTFTALTGAIGHFSMGQLPDPLILALCAVFTLIWAQISAHVANRVSVKILNRVMGITLLILGAAIFLVNYVF